jgi:hypothetical protein
MPGRTSTLREDVMVVHCRLHPHVVTKRWRRCWWMLRRMSMPKEGVMAMHYTQHHNLVMRRSCRYW